MIEMIIDQKKVLVVLVFPASAVCPADLCRCIPLDKCNIA